MSALEWGIAVFVGAIGIGLALAMVGHRLDPTLPLSDEELRPGDEESAGQPGAYGGDWEPEEEEEA